MESIARRSQSASPSAFAVFALALAAGLAATWFYFSRGTLLDYGDAAAHLNIARRIVDTRSPGALTLGTVWLPLPHLLLAPLTAVDALWNSALAGAAINVPAFALAVLALFLLVRELANAQAAAVAALALAANPSLLYLAATPMTEPLSLCLILWTTYLALAQHPARCGLVATLASLTRYEAWVLLPLVALYFGHRHGLRAALRFSSVAALGPLWWFAHNWWFWGDALEFYRGEYSAQAVYARQMAAGVATHPATGNWRMSIAYFARAALLVVGWSMLAAGITGWLLSLRQRSFTLLWTLTLLAAPALLVVWTLHSAGTQIYVPGLWPNTLMNTRYVLVALPLMAGGLGLAVKNSRVLPVLAVLAIALPWINGSISAREGAELGRDRQRWTLPAARFLAANYRGGGIALSFGDLTEVLRQARVPLRDSLSDTSRLAFLSARARPELFLKEGWVLCFEGDELSRAATRSGQYALIKRFGKAQFWRRLSANIQQGFSRPGRPAPRRPRG